MKNEHIFTGRVKALVENMKETLDRLNMVQNIEDYQYAKNIMRTMMKDYLRFQIYVCKLKKLNGAGEIIPQRYNEPHPLTATFSPARLYKAHSDTKELSNFEQRFKENGERLRDMFVIESAGDTKQVLST